jgi:hypothetical protein
LKPSGNRQSSGSKTIPGWEPTVGYAKRCRDRVCDLDKPTPPCCDIGLGLMVEDGKGKMGKMIMTEECTDPDALLEACVICR